MKELRGEVYIKEKRKIIHIWSDPITDYNNLMSSQILALCSDQTIWRLQFTHEGSKAIWENTEWPPIPQEDQ